jgi:hypothetical protein
MTAMEQRLVLVLGVCAGLWVLLVIYRTYDTSVQEAQKRLANAREQRAEMRRWLGEEEIWSQRGAWLKEHQPQAQSVSQASAELVAELQNTAREAGITLQEQELSEGVQSPASVEVGARVRGTGTLQAICQWMTTLQQPGKFRLVNNFVLKSDPEPGKIQLQMRVIQRFAPAAAPQNTVPVEPSPSKP